MALRVVFAGTPAFAVPLLKALVEGGHPVVLVVTQPDRPAGRGLKVRASPVKELVCALGLELWQPERPTPEEWVQRLRPLRPDVLVVAAFAHRIPVQALAFLPFGCLNVHPSLLPRWRGAAPVAWTLLAGDRLTGVTLMQMDEGWDTGPLLLQRTERVRPDDTTETLQQRLAQLGASLLLEGLRRLEAGTLQPLAQDPAVATLAPRLHKDQGRIDWSRDALAIERQVRALYPWPGAYTYVKGRLLKVLGAAAELPPATASALPPATTSAQAPATAANLPPGTGSVLPPATASGAAAADASSAASAPAPAPAALAPGQVVGVRGERESLVVACGQGVLHLLQVQLEGGRPISGRDLANGLRLKPGDRLGEEPS